MKKLFITSVLLISFTAFSETKLINGKPAGNMFPAVGTFNLGCTITKVGKFQFISAAHCIGSKLPALNLSFKTYQGRVNVDSFHVHQSWLKDCAQSRCDGTEVGSSRMTPGRSDVVFINVKEETPAIPVIEINYSELPIGKEVAMVGAGCTRGVEPGGRDGLRYAITKLISPKNLVHEHSLYKDISEITGHSNWITPGYRISTVNASLCPGDSGGPLLTKNDSGAWTIVGIAADYTFDGPYTDGNETITNLHTRLDDQSLNRIGQWIRSVWKN